MKDSSITVNRLNNVSLWVLTILRIAIGWHFLYEGIVKLTSSGWTSASYLLESRWMFEGFFHWIAAHPGVLQVVDVINIWGLILVGLGLMLGMLSRYAAIGGVVLLAFYYTANPPFISATGAYLEGHYVWIDKNLIELIALVVLVLIPTGHFMGLDGLLRAIRLKVHRPKPDPAPLRQTNGEPGSDDSNPNGRRDMLRQLATLPVLGAFTYAAIRKQKWDSFEEKILQANTNQPDSSSGATIKSFNFASLKDLKGTLPKGKIGDMEISRMIAGGNLMGGWAHSRDLMYVNKLVKAYHHDQKIFETFKIAEACGINTILTNPQLNRVINKYWRTQGGEINFISDCGYQMDPYKGIELSIEGGAHACYVQGGIADQFVIDGRVDELGECVETIRKHGIPGGIGGHNLETIQACVEAGIKPDFWVKTLHHVNYWSATPELEMDNIWCTKPEETVTFMERLEEPWIGFKTLAAGAILPEVGFPYAFKGGADFICVGMYDFQVVEDVNLVLDILNDESLKTDRKRPWRA